METQKAPEEGYSSKADNIDSTSSLYLVDLFQKRMGGTGYINRLADYKNCDNVIIIGKTVSHAIQWATQVHQMYHGNFATS